MIEIIIYENASQEVTGYIIKGHSNYAPRGQDIVCASISSLTLATTMALQKLVSAGEKQDLSGEKLVSGEKQDAQGQFSGHKAKLAIAQEDGILSLRIADYGKLAPRLKEDIQLLISTMELGLKEIEKQYPDFVKLQRILLGQNNRRMS